MSTKSNRVDIAQIIQTRFLTGWRMWAVFITGILLGVEIVVSLTELLLRGEVTSDYLLTGFVAAIFVGPTALFLLSRLLQRVAAQHQKALSDAAASAEIQLRVALDASDEGVLMVTKDGRVLSFNRRFLELWHVPPALAAGEQDESLLSHVLDQLLEPEDFLAEVRRLYGTTAESNDTLRFRDGRVFARHSRPLTLDQVEGRIWCFRDISEQARAEAALAEREELYRTIVSQAGDGIDLVDAATLRIVEVNDSACRMLGYRRDELLQMSLAKIQGDLDEDALREAVARVVSAGHASLEARHRRKDGSLFDIQINIRTICIHERTYLVGVWRDITERNRASAEILQARNRLQVTLNAIPDLMFEIGNDDRIRGFHSPKAELLFAPPEVLIGKTFSSAMPPDAAQALAVALSEARKTGYSAGQQYDLQLPHGKFRFELSVSHKPGAQEDSGVAVVLARDITERSRTERNLRMAVESAQVILWELDLCSGRLTFDKTMLATLGLELEPRLEWISGWIEHVHPDDLDEFIKHFQAVSSAEESVFEMEYRIANCRGGYEWLHTTGRVIQRDESGKAVIAVGTSLNISARKHAEEAIRDSEAKYRELVINANAIILRMAFDGTVTYFNEFAERFFGYASAEILGKSVVGTIVPERDSETGQDLRAMIEAIIAHPEMHADNENQNMTRDGRRVYVRWSNRVILDSQDRPAGLLCIGQDTTERRQISAELEQHRTRLEDLVQQRTAELLATEARASRILESAADGLYGVDSNGLVTFINPAGCRMLGCDAAQIIGRSAHAVFHHSHSDGSPYPLEECPSHAAVLGGHEVRIDSECYWRADGSPIPVMYAVHPTVEDGRCIGAVISFVDMSVQKAAAEAREQALAAAEALIRARSEFLANMSHEIRTPMNGVLGFAEIGLRNHGNVEKARNAFEKILASGKQLLGVVNEVLDFSKIEAGSFRIDASEISLAEVIDRAMELVADRARAKGLALILDRAQDFPATCVSDSLRLGQVLLNLLTNAVKFTESGSVTLSAMRQGERLLFRVSDTGIGIEPEHLERIFDPFQQADNSTTRRFGGTGLGLAISRRILELMGGNIRASSRSGTGSSFEFDLPYVRPASSESLDGLSKVAKMPIQKPLAGISILVAEDNDINQMILEENLVEDGARVVMVGNGRDAVEHVIRGGASAFDLVLMDVQMPIMDGYEATRRILELAPAMPVIGQTAHAFDEEREKCFAAGMVSHIAKPIDTAALTELIRETVAACRSSQ